MSFLATLLQVVLHCVRWLATPPTLIYWPADRRAALQLERNNIQKVKEGHKTNMDFPTICKKFYYCLHQTTLYVKVILLKACFKYEKAYIKNRFFKDFTGRVHLHFARVTSFLLPPLWNGELTPSLSGIPSDTVDDEATSRLQ